GAVLQVDRAASAHQAILWHLGERGEDTDLDRGVGLRAGRHRPKAARAGGVALHIAPGPFSPSIRKNAYPVYALGDAHQIRRGNRQQPIEFVRILTGQQWVNLRNRRSDLLVAEIEAL